MPENFLLLEVRGGLDRGNPRPPGTMVIRSADDLDEIREYLDMKCGTGTTRRLRTDGGEK